MKKQITIPTIEEAETFRLGSTIESLAERKTAERIATRVAEALALTHDGYADGVEWSGPHLPAPDGEGERGTRIVSLVKIDGDELELATPGGPLESVWVPITQEDSEYGVAYVLAMLTILQNPEEAEVALLPALHAAADRNSERRPGEDEADAVRRWGREVQIVRDAERLVRTRWHDVGETADEAASLRG
tara:strand:+ start:1098 stop:1667 length:570 start_codon:yes stop_codon:yes gene_type:complete